MKQILFSIVFACSVNSFALTVPDFMVGNWEQASRDEESDKITISQKSNPAGEDPYNYEIVVSQSRQVGREDDAAVPYPTLCRYRYTGMITEFGPARDERKKYYRDSGKDEPTLALSYTVTKVQLLPALYNSPNCAKFIERQSEKAVSGELSYSWDFTDLMDDVLSDPWYRTVFVKRR